MSASLRFGNCSSGKASKIGYSTPHRLTILVLQVATATTIPVRDVESGQEVQLNIRLARHGWLTLPERKRRRFRTWVFVAARSRHRFVQSHSRGDDLRANLRKSPPPAVRALH
jgi:hypothetical protein